MKYKETYHSHHTTKLIENLVRKKSDSPIFVKLNFTEKKFQNRNNNIRALLHITITTLPKEGDKSTI